MDEGGISEIARCSRQTPRVANRILKRVRDFAQIHEHDIISEDIAKKALAMLDIDPLGLEPSDRHILETIIKKFNGGPVGIQTIASATSEEIQTIEDVFEPYLIQIGFLARTPRGRIVTENAFKHLGIEMPSGHQKKLI